jgi:sigma-B regulation protein RsbU (phosphoserine phosphatase)
LMKKMREFNARVESELESARHMQQSLLPKESEVSDIEAMLPVAMASYFAASSELSGDFWGTMPLSKHELAFFLVDFTGHGIMAALNTFRLHALINSDVRPTNNPGEYLTQLNKKLYELLIEQHFATMFYGVIDFKENKLRYAGAASPSPIMFNKDHEKGLKFIDGSGLPLGVMKNTQYTTLEVPFNQGDTLMCYSDALIEKENKDGQMFDEQQLMRFAHLYHKKNAGVAMQDTKKLCDSALEYFYKETGDRTLNDDLTVAIFHRI